MNLLLFSGADRLDENTIRVRDHRLTHLQKVTRSKVGDHLRVGELSGLTGNGELTRISDESAELQVTLSDSPPQKLPLTIILALPRPKMLRRILRSVAEMGVAELHLINSYRVEKSYWQTPVLDPACIEKYLIAGLEQARDTILPEVKCHNRFKPFAQDTLPVLCKGRDALLLHPGDYPACPNALGGESLLVIGPEGGFIPFEVELLQGAGCRPVCLGRRILRVENALNAAVGRFL